MSQVGLTLLHEPFTNSFLQPVAEDEVIETPSMKWVCATAHLKIEGAVWQGMRAAFRS